MSYYSYPYYVPCVEQCVNIAPPCKPVCAPTPVPCSDGPVTLSTSPVIITTIVNSSPNVPITNGTVYNPQSFPPPGTVTVIGGFPGTTTVNLGNITAASNGTFTVPTNGTYAISASVNFTYAYGTLPVNIPTITLYIYRINSAGIISLLASIVQNGASPTTTVTNVSQTTTAELASGDRIFFAANTTVSPYSVGNDSRFVITRLVKTC